MWSVPAPGCHEAWREVGGLGQENLVQAGGRHKKRQAEEADAMVDQEKYLQKQFEVMPLKEGQ